MNGSDAGAAAGRGLAAPPRNYGKIGRRYRTVVRSRSYYRTSSLAVPVRRRAASGPPAARRRPLARPCGCEPESGPEPGPESVAGTSTLMSLIRT